MENWKATGTFISMDGMARACGFMEESLSCGGRAGAARRRRMEIRRFKEIVNVNTCVEQPVSKRSRLVSDTSYTFREYGRSDSCLLCGEWEQIGIWSYC